MREMRRLREVLSSLAKTGVSSPVLTSRAAAKIKQLDLQSAHGHIYVGPNFKLKVVLGA